MKHLAGKLVLVTGAGSGIGRATALAFARAGSRVLVIDIVGASARDTAERARRVSGTAESFQVDVSNGGDMEALGEQVRTQHGVVDIVVNNAGVGVSGPLLQTPTREWERLIGVNLWGVIHGCRVFGAQMVARGAGGHIVNVSSAAAFHPSRMLPAYATTKAAVLMLSESLRAELAPQGIGVSAICPGLVNTPIVGSATYLDSDPARAARRREAALRLYRRRNYGPERVAARILEAVRRNQAVVPVTPEAHVLRHVGRLLPGVARTLAAFELPDRV